MGRQEDRLAEVAQPGDDVSGQPPCGRVSLHLMCFAMMENELEREEVLAFLKGLADALDGFVSGVEQYVASGAQSARRHAELALEHGIAVHRASLEWTRSAMAALAEPSGAMPG